MLTRRQKEELTTAYTDSLRALWVIIYILTGIAFIAGFFYKGKIIRKGFLHNIRTRNRIARVEMA
jgi:hypothetical protein